MSRPIARQAVILAGGLGTRMLPRTERIPKVLLDVAGRPFASWQIEALVDSGYDDVVLCIAHLGEQVREYLGDGSAFGVRVRYVDEGARLAGTGGALCLAADEGVLEQEFLVTYGDSFLPFNYAGPLDRLREERAYDGVMAVYRNEGRWDPSNVRLSNDGLRVARYEKGSPDPLLDHIDYGATALRRSVLDEAPRKSSFGLDTLQHRLAIALKLGAIVASERFFEIGSPQGHADLEAYFAARATKRGA